MRHVLVIHWTSAKLSTFMVRGQSSTEEIVDSKVIKCTSEPADWGRRLAEFVSALGSKPDKVVLSLDRGLLDWQHLSLPPCPDEDLPDLVRLQADNAESEGAESLGIDFLPLEGGVDQPRKVCCVSLSPSRHGQLQAFLAAAELTADHICPAVLGWPELVSLQASEGLTTIALAPYGSEPAIWAADGDGIRMLRLLQLPPTDAEQFASSLATQLKRTLLAYSQAQPAADETAVQLLAMPNQGAEKLCASLSDQLSKEVLQHDIDSLSSQPDTNDDTRGAILGLANSAIAGTAPLIDLAHPRQRPAEQSSRRTYYLAAAALASVLGLLAWQGYRSLQAPLEQAAQMQAEIESLAETKQEYAAAETEAAAIRAWLGSSVNLLSELRAISSQVRTEPLDAETFPVDDDVLVGRLNLTGRQIVIDAYARENSDLQPVEYRLRDGKYRVRRGETSQSEEVKDYPVKFQAIIDVTDGPMAIGAEP